MVNKPQGSGMMYLVVAFILISSVLAGSYWYFVMNKPSATVMADPTESTVSVTITGYANPVYIVLKNGTSITHATYVTSGTSKIDGLIKDTTYILYAMSEDFQNLLATITFTSKKSITAGPTGPTGSTVPSGPSPGPSDYTVPSVPTGPTGSTAPSPGPVRAPGPQ